MKLLLVKSNIKDSFSIIERSGGENINLPVLKNFLFKARDSKICITSTNLEVAATSFIQGKIIEEGETTVPILIFSTIINNLQSERLNFETNGDNLLIKADNYEAAIKSLPAKEFPLIPKVKNQNEYVEIKAELLKEALGQVLIATQFSDLRPELNSVFFNFSVDDIKLAATDSFRLAEKIIPSTQFNSNYNQGFKVLIPLKTVHEVVRTIKSDEVVRIYHDENQILFKSERMEFISRLVEGNFPEYQSIMPKKFSSELVVNREEFVNALKLASIFGDRTGEVKFKVPENKKVLEIFSSEQTIGGNKYLLPAKIQGKAAEVGFNWRYLIDSLKVIKTEEVSFSINNEENKPSLLKSPNEGSYTYVVMPLIRP